MDSVSLVPKRDKDISLEAIRGIAAIVVLVWHFFFAFYPQVIFDPVKVLVGSPFYAFVHGTGAVDMFFLLSGYVLTIRYFATREDKQLIRAASKRYFRLLPLVLLSVLASWAAYHFSLYGYKEAAAISRSEWLYYFAGAHTEVTHPSFINALWQGVFGAFFLSETDYNTSLWTIHIELFGSMIAFSFAWLLHRLRRFPLRIVFLSVAFAFMASFINDHYVAFLLGPLLAFTSPRFKGMSWKTGVPLLVGGVFLLGYRAPYGAYSSFAVLADLVERDRLYVILSLTASAMILMACVGWHGARSFLQGRLSYWLGRISYPLYLFHIPLICSLGAFVFSRLVVSEATYVAGLSVTAAILAIATVTVGWLLSYVDVCWVKYLNRALEGRGVDSNLGNAQSQQVVNM